VFHDESCLSGDLVGSRTLIRCLSSSLLALALR
jgi:hypothetical protein